MEVEKLLIVAYTIGLLGIVKLLTVAQTAGHLDFEKLTGGHMEVEKLTVATAAAVGHLEVEKLTVAQIGVHLEVEKLTVAQAVAARHLEVEKLGVAQIGQLEVEKVDHLDLVMKKQVVGQMELKNSKEMWYGQVLLKDQMLDHFEKEKQFVRVQVEAIYQLKCQQLNQNQKYPQIPLTLTLGQLKMMVVQQQLQ